MISACSGLSYGGASLGGAAALDEMFISAAESAILEHQANVILVQQSGYDMVSHCWGIQTPESDSILDRLKTNLERLILAAQKAGTYDDTVFAVMSDHLMFKVETYVYLNNLFLQEGFIQKDDEKITKLDVYGETLGRSFLVHVNDRTRSTISRLLTSLNSAVDQGAWGIEKLLLPSDLDELRAGNFYDLACIAKPGVAFMNELNPNCDMRKVKPDDYLKAHHGHDPRGNCTAFAIWGPGIKKGYDIGNMNVVDIAPTLAKVLGIDFPCSGKVLDVFEDDC
jgi:predicted AlkP superfamily pyrophosphatase or phosphodiesterase